MIGDGQPCFIIAEAGLNHDGDLEQAKRLIRAAAEAEADLVKFQIYRTEEFCSRSAAYYDLFKGLEFSTEEWGELADTARDTGILFSGSVFGEESTDLLDRLGTPLFKVASGDLTDLPLLEYIAARQRPIILSTGMAHLSEVEEALRTIYESGNGQVALLHCVSSYPTAVADANLLAIRQLKEVFRMPVGFSDHTEGSLIPAVAVAVGAQLIEKHFTLDRRLPGPDHALSLEPADFREMVKTIRSVEAALGDGLKRPAAAEEEIRPLARRSLAAREGIAAGDILTEEKIKIVRPGTGIEPKHRSIVVGRAARNAIAADTPITWSDV